MAPAQATLFILYGDDEVSIRAKINEIVEKFCPGGAEAFDLVRLEGASLTLENLRNAVLSLPFMGGKRVVVTVSPLARLTATRGGTTSKSGDSEEESAQDEQQAEDRPGGPYEKQVSPQQARKVFTSLLENLPSSTVLVVVEHQILVGPKPDQPHWLLKWAAGREGVEVVASVVGASGMARWISQRARDLKGSISPAAAAALAYKAGADTRIAMHELDKLLAFVNYRRTIEQDDVEQVSTDSSEAKIFDYVDALALRNAAQAMKLLRRLLEEQEPIFILAMVIRQFRLLLLGRNLLDANATMDESKKGIDTHSEWLVRKVLDQARRFNRSTLEAVYRRLLAMDTAIKSGEVDTDVALETFTAAFTSPPVHSK
jgi:DNA polymerase-3 subunit delta